MKWPFSYKSNIFTTALGISVAGHIFVLGLGGFLPMKADFSVVRAPESMEIVMIEQKVVPKIVQPVKQEVLKAEKSPEKVQVKKIVKHTEPKELKDSVVVPPIKGAIFEAKPIGVDNPSPVYPKMARRRGWEGVVHLKVFVQNDGLPGDVIVEKSAGHQVLDDAALKTVKKWKFQAARRGNKTYSSWINIPIRFKLIN